MLHQAKTSYDGLHMQLANLMNQKSHHQLQEVEENEGVVEGKNKQIEGKDYSSVLVPRQFMDLGLVANAAKTDEPSLSSSARKSQESSKNEMITSDEATLVEQESSNNNKNKEIVREVEADEIPTPNSKSNTNKIPRFNLAAENVDQAEATMRKARVSVRARSEAPMVHNYIYSRHPYSLATT